METGEGVVIGCGWAWPPETNARGGVATVSGATLIDRSIVLILSTSPGERPMRPGFGCSVHDFVFAPANRTTAGRIERAVREALNQWEPRIVVDRVIVTSDSTQASILYIDIEYTIRQTNDRRNLVFPFYVIPDEAP